MDHNDLNFGPLLVLMDNEVLKNNILNIYIYIYIKYILYIYISYYYIFYIYIYIFHGQVQIRQNALAIKKECLF